MNIFPRIWSIVAILVLVSGLADKAMATEPAKAGPPRPADKPAPINRQNIDQESRRLHEAAIKLHMARKLREALPLAKKAVAIRDEVLGPRDFITMQAVLTLAQLYTALEKDAEGERLLNRIREVLAKTEAERGTYAIATECLADLYERRNEHAKAEPLYRQALEIFKKARWGTPPVYASGLNSLAGLYYERGDYAQAERLCREALEVYQQLPMKQTANSVRASSCECACARRKDGRDAGDRGHRC